MTDPLSDTTFRLTSRKVYVLRLDPPKRVPWWRHMLLRPVAVCLVLSAAAVIFMGLLTFVLTVAPGLVRP